jgi:2-phosphoglycerate kinase
MERNWIVLLVGGSSGIGKTTLTKRLAHKYGAKIIEADDICRSIYVMTTCEQYPSIHYWYGDGDWSSNTIEKNVEYLNEVCREVCPALKSIVEAHLDSDIPLIIEGDFISPDFVLSINDRRVKSVFLQESNESQIVNNYLVREGGSLQEFRASISYLYGLQVESRCNELQLSLVQVRPWSSILERVIENL